MLSTVAIRYLVSSTVALPAPLALGGESTQQLQVEVIVACAEACVIEDVALRARPVPGQEGELQPVLDAMDARMTGAGVTLFPFQLDGQPLDEAVLSRAFAGFEDTDYQEGRWTTTGTSLAEIPLQNSSVAVDVEFHGAEQTITRLAEGRIDTRAGVYIFRAGGTALYEGDLLTDRTWWAVAERADDSSQPAYLQGGVLRMLAEDEAVTLGPTEELDMAPEGASWDALQAGLAAYRAMDAELPQEPGTGPRFWVGAMGGASFRPDHDMALGGEFQLGTELDGLWFGLGVGTHLPGRLYRPFGVVGVQRAYPVQMADVYGLVGYRPDDTVFHPAVGVAWGASIRTYEGATPERIVMPIGGLEIRFGATAKESYTTEFVARALFDGGSTAVTRGNQRGGVALASATLGLCFTWEAIRL